MYYNPALLVDSLNKMGPDVFNHFIQQWIHDTDCFIGLHDRKVASILYVQEVVTHFIKVIYKKGHYFLDT